MKVVIETTQYPGGDWYVQGPDSVYAYGFAFTRELAKAHIYASPDLAMGAIALRNSHPPVPEMAGRWGPQPKFVLVPIEVVEVPQPPKTERRRLI